MFPSVSFHTLCQLLNKMDCCLWSTHSYRSQMFYFRYLAALLSASLTQYIASDLHLILELFLNAGTQAIRRTWTWRRQETTVCEEMCVYVCILWSEMTLYVQHSIKYNAFLFWCSGKHYHWLFSYLSQLCIFDSVTFFIEVSWIIIVTRKVFMSSHMLWKVYEYKFYLHYLLLYVSIHLFLWTVMEDVL